MHKLSALKPTSLLLLTSLAVFLLMAALVLRIVDDSSKIIYLEHTLHPFYSISRQVSTPACQLLGTATKNDRVDH